MATIQSSFVRYGTLFLAAVAIATAVTILLRQVSREPPAVSTPGVCTDSSKACSGRRWIGIKDPDKTRDSGIEYAKDCPSLSGYASSHLFRRGTLNQSDIAAIPLGLRRFCLYTWTGPEDQQPPELSEQTIQAVKNEGLVSLEKDCSVVGPAATFASSIEPYLEQQFYAQAGAVTGVAAGSSVGVRLSFLDTGPTNESDPQLDRANATCSTTGGPCSPHGHALVNMAQGLLCDGAAGTAQQTAGCGSVTIASRLAMPWINDKGVLYERPADGGTIGYLSDVAQAIHDEVAAWWTSANTGGAVRDQLILNLSLGWDPCYGGYEFQSQVNANEMPARAQSVHAAVQDAVCRGALVIASAGNFTGKPNVVANRTLMGPMLPAAWDVLPGPPAAFAGTPMTCGGALAVGRQATAPDLPQSYGDAKFMYAVGAVRADDHPLANARSKSFDRYVAFGDHAAVSAIAARGQPGMSSTSILTGSSVAAAVVSASAAAQWSRTPGESASDVMNAIYNSSRVSLTLSGAATVPTIAAGACTAAGCDVRRVRLCDVLQSPCPAEPSQPTLDPSIVATGALDPSGASQLQLGSACENEVSIAGTSGAASSPCAHWTIKTLSATPEGGPQPRDNPCPACSGKPGSWALLIDLDPDFKIEGQSPVTFSDVRLLVGSDIADLDGNQSTASRSYPLSDLLPRKLTGGQSAVICLREPGTGAKPLIRPEDSLALSMTAAAPNVEKLSILVPVLKFTQTDQNVHNLCQPSIPPGKDGRK